MLSSTVSPMCAFYSLRVSLVLLLQVFSSLQALLFLGSPRWQDVTPVCDEVSLRTISWFDQELAKVFSVLPLDLTSTQNMKQLLSSPCELEPLPQMSLFLYVARRVVQRQGFALLPLASAEASFIMAFLARRWTQIFSRQCWSHTLYCPPLLVLCRGFMHVSPWSP